MTRKCELCPTVMTRHSAPEQKPKPARLRRVLVEDRLLALCERHAENVRSHAPATLSELHQRYAEQSGKRSMLERRAALDRRAFPARPEGRRASSGRRATDRAE
jgi:hypothetical protein